MRWNDIQVGGRVYSMAHLRPFAQLFEIDGRQVKIHFTFGFHCFTDDKGNGHLITNGHERRYFCAMRYECSSQLRTWIDKRLLDCQVRLITDHKKNRRYFCMDLHDYAIFFDIRKPQETENELKLHVISAYEVANWGRPTLPKGKQHNLSWVLGMRSQGYSV